MSQRTTCRDYSRKMHFAEQDAWNLPTNKKSSFSAKPSSSGEPSALLEIKSHAMYSILRGGATPFRFSLSLSFLSLVVLVINLSDFFLIKLSNGKKKKTAASYWQRIFVWTKFTAWNCARVRCKFMPRSRSLIQHCLVERTSSCDGRFSTGL